MTSVIASLRRVRKLFLDPSIIAVSVAGLLTIVPVLAAQQKAAVAPKPIAPPAPPVIPVAEVATRATEVTNLLRSFDMKFAPSAEIESIAKALPVFKQLIDLENAATRNILNAQPSLELLQTQQQLWQRTQLRTTQWLNVLTNRATQL